MTTPTIPFYPVTHDDGTNIVSALNSIASARRTPLLIADAFSNLTNYDVNDYVIYENNLYRFTVAHPAGSWNYSQVVRVSLGEELERKVDNSAVAPEFRNDANYAVGDVVSYKGGLYRYLSPHVEGDWDRTEVVATNAISEGGDNMIITSSGRSIESLESSIAIVANGDTHPLINQGEYVYVKMHDTLPEGLYIANATIAENGTLSTSNLSGASKGGLNKLNENTINNTVFSSYPLPSSVTSYSDLQTKLTNVANDTPNGKTKVIRFYIDYDSTMFIRTSTCFGNLNVIAKTSSYLFFACLLIDNAGNVFSISYNNGPWSCRKLAFAS